TQFDFDTTVRLQDNISRRFDGSFSFLSLIGNFEFTSFFLIILIILTAVLRRKIFSFKQWLWGGLVFFFYGILHIIELYGKTFVEHLPPPHFLLRTEKIGDFPQFYVRSEYSYPSGHAARAAFLSIIIMFLLARNRKLTPVTKFILIGFLFLYDFLMIVSRVYLGEHWSTDVIGGSLLGAGLSILGLVLL
ncbi:MAG: phosphatase PAP2 family protein, partial [Actinobacteria bacterium]|nr:phosphatase PAP2 family protein [Actinomycetota bacterium]